MCKVGDINLSYECLTSPEVRQALVGLRDTNTMLYEQLSVPPPSVPMPPPPPDHDGSYPEDREHEDDKMFTDSSLSVDELVAWIADEAQGVIADPEGDEDEGIDGFGHDDESRGPTPVLGPFNSQFATSSWTRWDGTT